MVKHFLVFAHTSLAIERKRDKLAKRETNEEVTRTGNEQNWILLVIALGTFVDARSVGSASCSGQRDNSATWANEDEDGVPATFPFLECVFLNKNGEILQNDKYPQRLDGAGIYASTCPPFAMLLDPEV